MKNKKNKMQFQKFSIYHLSLWRNKSKDIKKTNFWNCIKIKLVSICLFALPVFAFAQTENKNGNVGEENVLVIKNYQASLSDAYKISDTPEQDTTTSITPVFKYEIEPKKL